MENTVTPNIIKPVSMIETKKLFIETYGCQMNVADSEVVVSLLKHEGFVQTNQMNEADVILINTCSIRDKAEQTVRKRLTEYNKTKKLLKREKKDIIIGVIGCMAERLKETLLEEEKMVDMVIGPDAYRQIPQLIKVAESGQKAVNVLLSKEETYADISPVRLDKNGVSAYVSIMRGCDNLCAFCVVPYTRGRERSRDARSILREIGEIVDQGYKEITLLGQNVDSYKWSNESQTVTFANLLEMSAQEYPKTRIRFSTSHPKDITDDVLHTMAKYDNICKCIHLPVQSGSSKVLDEMRRGYTREWYIEKVNAIREILPDCSITSDIISGFCNETEEDHLETLSIIRWAKYDFSYMYKYSERPDTYAAKRMEDNVPEDIKGRRLKEIVELQHKISLHNHKKDIGKTFEVLVEKVSKKSVDDMVGRNSQNKAIVFAKGKNTQIGDFVLVKVTECTSATLIGHLV